MTEPATDPASDRTTDGATDRAIDEAYAARLAGRGDVALATGQRLLAADPGDAQARGLVGACRLDTGDLAGARALIQGAVADAPQDWRLLINLSALREAEGDLDGALSAAEQAQAAAARGGASGRFEPWGRLGDLLARRGAYAEAVTALDQALAIRPDHAGIALLLAGAALEAGRIDIAARVLPIFEQAAPGHPQALRLRTHLTRRSGDVAAFAGAAAAWLAAEPDAVAARVAAAHAAALQEDYHRAVALTRPLVAAEPANADHAALLARYLLWARDFAGAEAEYKRALALRAAQGGTHADAAAGLARLHIYQGRLDAAAALAAQAIAADPAHIDGYNQLALATDGRITDAALTQLERLAADPAIEADNRAVAWFTIGDVYHRRRERAQAFAAWTEANALKQAAIARTQGAAYDARATERQVERLMALFAAAPAIAAGAGVMEAGGAAGGVADVPVPLFIVGMPRSGTTLLDSALAAHRDIASGGELPMLPALLTRFLAWAEQAGWRGGAIPEPVAAQLRARYLEQYATYGIASARFVTDKQPVNFWSVGLIRQLFPTAPIIHIRRDALETGFSIYRKNFSRAWPFATAQDSIGHYYGQYQRIMAHWQAVCGGAMAQVDYEVLVGDFEGELRRLLRQFGIGWDPGCLTYHERESIVTTLSATQVRAAPTSAHFHATAPYATMLAPLRAALQAAGVD